MTDKTKPIEAPERPVRVEGSVRRAEDLLDLLESDFGQSGRDVRLEAILCEFDDYESRLYRIARYLRAYHCHRNMACRYIWDTDAARDAHADCLYRPPNC